MISIWWNAFRKIFGTNQKLIGSHGIKARRTHTWGVTCRVACWPVVCWDASSSLQLSASFPSRGLAMRRAGGLGQDSVSADSAEGWGARRPRGRFRSAGLRQDPHSLGILAGWSGTIKWSNLSWFRSAWEYSNIYFFPSLLLRRSLQIRVPASLGDCV